MLNVNIKNIISLHDIRLLHTYEFGTRNVVINGQMCCQLFRSVRTLMKHTSDRCEFTKKIQFKVAINSASEYIMYQNFEISYRSMVVPANFPRIPILLKRADTTDTDTLVNL